MTLMLGYLFIVFTGWVNKIPRKRKELPGFLWIIKKNRHKKWLRNTGATHKLKGIWHYIIYIHFLSLPGTANFFCLCSTSFVNSPALKLCLVTTHWEQFVLPRGSTLIKVSSVSFSLGPVYFPNWLNWKGHKLVTSGETEWLLLDAAPAVRLKASPNQDQSNHNLSFLLWILGLLKTTRKAVIDFVRKLRTSPSS